MWILRIEHGICQVWFKDGSYRGPLEQNYRKRLNANRGSASRMESSCTYKFLLFTAEYTYYTVKHWTWTILSQFHASSRQQHPIPRVQWRLNVMQRHKFLAVRFYPQKVILTAKITANTSVLPLKTQIERLLDVEKLKVADWMEPKKDIMAVLEYWQGYLLPILDWRRNHRDQSNVPRNKQIKPIVQFCVLLAELSLVAWSRVEITACECEELNKGLPR